jgi:hypothetical protein
VEDFQRTALSTVLGPYRACDGRLLFPADFGLTDNAQGQFIQELVAGASNSIELLPVRTGFVDAVTFVTHTEILHADGTRTPVPRNNDPASPTFVDTKGTLQGTTDLVLKLATESTYLAFALASRSLRLCRAT